MRRSQRNCSQASKRKKVELTSMPTANAHQLKFVYFFFKSAAHKSNKALHLSGVIHT